MTREETAYEILDDRYGANSAVVVTMKEFVGLCKELDWKIPDLVERREGEYWEGDNLVLRRVE